MIDIGRNRQAVYRAWLEQRLDTKLSDKSVFMANVNGPEILGVVGFDRFTGSSIELSKAGDSPKWITRQFIKLVFSYVFNS